MLSAHRIRKSKFAQLAGKTVLLISHDFSLTGGPLLLIETAREMRHAGLNVALTSLLDDASTSKIANLAAEAIVPLSESMVLANQSDVIIANTAVTGPWVRECLNARPERRHRVVWWLHEIDTTLYGHLVRDLDQVAALVFDSEASLQNWRDTGKAMPADTEVIFPGVRRTLLDLADRAEFRFAPRWALRFGWYRCKGGTEMRRSLGVSRSDFLVTLIGTYVPYKGHDLFAESVEQMRSETPSMSIKGLLVGFSSWDEAREFCARHRLSAESAVNPRRVLPMITDLSPYYAASDAFVMNTQGLGENFGRVTTEAMAFRLPICGTDAGGTREILVPGTGFLHPVGSRGQEQLKANLRRLVDDRALARRAGEAGHQRVCDHYTDTKMFERLAALLKRVVTGVSSCRQRLGG